MKKRTHENLPTRHHGGQEPPDDAQDRPEQNKGYDAAVRGDSTATPQGTLDEAEVISLETGPLDADLTVDPENESETEDES
jgi:hypothetical protein